MPDQSKLSVENLSLQYYQPKTGNKVLAIANLNLKVKPGEFLSIVGPSGCGKTTLLYLIDGLLKPTLGKIYLDGREVSIPGSDRAVVFQQPSLFPWLSVMGNVLYGSGCRQSITKDIIARARELIELVGLEGFENNFPYELSGGMQQRVNLGRALLVDPEILLMDEPFASLDAQTREVMQEELLRIWNATKKTVIFVTHQIEEAVYLSDRVLVLTRRPSRAKEIVNVNLPRPRNLHIKRSGEFLQTVDRIWELIEKEVKTAMEVDKRVMAVE